MGLFDAIREKASELLSGATEKAGELTGDLPGAQEVTDLAGQAGDVAGQAGEVAGQAEERVAGAVGDLGVAADGVGESLPDGPPEPYRP